MSRIGTFGASQMYLSRLMATQQRLNATSLQVATEKKSPNYTGLSTDATRLLNFETETALATQFKKNNDFAATKLTAAQTSLNAVQTTIKQFRDRLTASCRATPPIPTRSRSCKASPFRR